MNQTAAESAQSGQLQRTISPLRYLVFGFGSIVGTAWVVLLGGWLVYRGARWPSARQWRHSAIVAFFLLVIGNRAAGVHKSMQKTPQEALAEVQAIIDAEVPA